MHSSMHLYEHRVSDPQLWPMVADTGIYILYRVLDLQTGVLSEYEYALILVTYICNEGVSFCTAVFLIRIWLARFSFQ